MRLDWRRIEDEDPPTGEFVMVWLEEASLCGHVYPARYTPKGQPTIIGHHFSFDLSRATHWAPMPEGPEE